MSETTRVEEYLGVQELRDSFLQFTEKAFKHLPALPDPARILVVGCGTGSESMLLARLSSAEIVAVDPDEKSLEVMRARVAAAGLESRITILKIALPDLEGLEDDSFDIVWAEGVFHLVDSEPTFARLHRLLHLQGLIVCHETDRWFNDNRDRILSSGFHLHNTLPLPPNQWQTAYGSPLEARIHEFKAKYPGQGGEMLSHYEEEVDWLKHHPEESRCSFYIVESEVLSDPRV